MGYTLIWIESLATALLFVTLFIALSGRLKRRLWQFVWPILTALLPLVILLPATVFGYFLRQYHVAPTWLFGYTLSLKLFYLSGVIFFFYYGLARGGNAPASNTWSRSKLAIAFTVTSILSFITVIFMASAMRVKLDAVQTNVRTLVLSCLPARVPDHKNAAPVYQKAFDTFGKQVPDWFNNSCKPDFDPTTKEVKRFLQDKRDVLALLHRATAMPGYYIDIDLSNKVSLPRTDFIDWRNAARLLSLDARSNAARRKNKAAMESIRDIRSLATHTSQIPDLIYFMITAALYNIRFEALENILTSPPFTLSPELVSSPIELTDHYFKDFKCALLMEEAIALNYFSNNCLLGLIIEFAPKTSNKDPILLWWKKAHAILHPFLTPVWYIFMLPEDLISKQANMREFRKFASKPYHEIGEDLNKWETSVETNLGGILTAITNPNIRPCVTKATESKVKHRLASLALATAAYQAKKGRYPAPLDNLVPDYITKIPTDPFDGKSLKMKVTEGGLVLYSVGVNGVDDGSEEYDKAAKTGDITFCLGKAYRERRLKPAQ